MGTHNSKLKNKNQRGEKGNKKSLKSHPAHAGHEPLCCLFENKAISKAKLSHMQCCKRGKESQETGKDCKACNGKSSLGHWAVSCSTYFNKANVMKHSPVVHNTTKKLDLAAEISSQTPPLQILASWHQLIASKPPDKKGQEKRDRMGHPTSDSSSEQGQCINLYWSLLSPTKVQTQHLWLLPNDERWH